MNECEEVQHCTTLSKPLSCDPERMTALRVAEYVTHLFEGTEIKVRGGEKMGQR